MSILILFYENISSYDKKATHIGNPINEALCLEIKKVCLDVQIACIRPAHNMFPIMRYIIFA